ncbi:hypothetical protein OG21DRAFT_1518460 [Imleria badia]|nr:hypothetical protein OG21DRAFT_1518460 [Imleria badia]
MLAAQGTQIRHYIRSFADAHPSDLANERLPMFQPADETDYPVIPAPSMRRRNSSDLEELGMEIRRLDEEVSDSDLDMDRNRVQQVQQQKQKRSERVVETRRSKVTTRTVSSKRYEGA